MVFQSQNTQPQNFSGQPLNRKIFRAARSAFCSRFDEILRHAPDQVIRWQTLKRITFIGVVSFIGSGRPNNSKKYLVVPSFYMIFGTYVHQPFNSLNIILKFRWSVVRQSSNTWLIVTNTDHTNGDFQCKKFQWKHCTTIIIDDWPQPIHFYRWRAVRQSSQRRFAITGNHYYGFGSRVLPELVW